MCVCGWDADLIFYGGFLWESCMGCWADNDCWKSHDDTIGCYHYFSLGSRYEKLFLPPPEESSLVAKKLTQVKYKLVIAMESMSINLLQDFLRYSVSGSWGVVKVFREGWSRWGFKQKKMRGYTGQPWRIMLWKHGYGHRKPPRAGAQLVEPLNIR